MKKIINISLVFILFLSCTTRSLRRVKMLEGVLEKQEYTDAILDIRNNKNKYGNINRFLYWYDQGILFHYAGEYDSSIYHLEMAEQVLDELYARSVTNEVASLVTNDNIRPYRGRRYEQVLLHQFLSFDYLAQNNVDDALVESRKVQLIFDRFKSKNGKRNKYSDDGMSHFVSSLCYEELGELDNSAISIYKSVKAYKNGSIPLPNEVRDFAKQKLIASDRLEDIKELGIENGKTLNSNALRNKSLGEIIIVGYAGLGPILDETVCWGTYVVGGLVIIHYRNPTGDTITVTFPAPPLPESEYSKGENEDTKIGTTYHIKFALPTPVLRKSRTVDFLTKIDSNDKPNKSFIATNTNILLEQNIEDERSLTLARTVLRVVLRTLASQRAKAKMTTSDPLLNLLVNVGTDVVAGQLEKADTRLCFLLPKTIQFTRISVTPGVHCIKTIARDKNGNAIEERVWSDIKVKTGEKKFLFFPVLL